MSDQEFSIVIPAKNEAENLQLLLPRLVSLFPRAEIIVVNDGSNDSTEAVCSENGVTVVSNSYSKGNGASIKAGARRASHDTVLFMDGDGQHRPEDIPALFEKFQEGFDMVVGARSSTSQASIFRLFANSFYNRLSSWISGQKIEDLTSGFRLVKKSMFLRFLNLLPNGFSYPTTITMAFFRAGYNVGYVPIEAAKRLGKSHINLIKDGFRFIIIIFKIGTLYSPLKIFIPISLVFFITGLGYYCYTFITTHSFTNMSAVLFITSIIVFLIGLVSEQITVLMYMNDKHD